MTTAGLYLLWLVLDPSAGGEARFALVPLILTQQVFVFVRLLIKVGYYAGISEALTRAPSPEYSYVADSADARRRQACGRPSLHKPVGRYCRPPRTKPRSTARRAASKRTR